MIRVIIERRLFPGMESSYKQVIREVKFQASGMPGYISGEALRNVEDHNVWLIVATWRTFTDWQAWQDSEAREELLAKIGPMLEQPETVSVYESGV